jgi:5-methylcytosine-specific restriction endonuclease McrA
VFSRHMACQLEKLSKIRNRQRYELYRVWRIAGEEIMNRFCRCFVALYSSGWEIIWDHLRTDRFLESGHRCLAFPIGHLCDVL